MSAIANDGRAPRPKTGNEIMLHFFAEMAFLIVMTGWPALAAFRLRDEE
jgi:hypothetical protein